MAMAELTIGKVKRLVLKSDPGLKQDDPGFRAAVVLLSSAHVGPNIRRLVVFTGFTAGEIAGFSKNLRKSKVWRGSKVRADWFGENGGIALALDVNVALGYLERCAA
jgi:hypothetical protein